MSSESKTLVLNIREGIEIEMKKIKWILVLVVIFGIGIMTACSSNEKKDEEDSVPVEGSTEKEDTLITKEEFVSDFIVALENRWDVNESIQNAPEIEKYDNYNKCAQAELDVLEQYKDRKFDDETFGEIVQKYILALEQQKKAYEYKDDKEKYDEMWGQGKDARATYLRQMNEIYNFVDKFTDSKYVKEFESMTGVYTQKPVEEITNMDWTGIWGTVIADTPFGFHIDSIDETAKTCEVYVYAHDSYSFDSDPVKGIILDDERLYFAFEDSAHNGDEAYTVKFIVEKDERIEEGYKLIINWQHINATTDDNVHAFVSAMNDNNLDTIALGRQN